MVLSIMARSKLVPTKTNLLRLKRDLSFAREGYELLEQKRQILVMELMALMDKTAVAQGFLEKELAAAYRALQNAVLADGKSAVAAVAPAVNFTPELTITSRRVMGVHLTVEDKAPYFSPGETSFWMDESIARFKKVLEALGVLVELRVSLLRLAYEVRKTVRRVNALEKIAIPNYEETIKYIQDTLEEAERGMFATLKLVKVRLEKKKTPQSPDTAAPRDSN
jgi:V/A-type H+-transporting ATPase subunit D